MKINTEVKIVGGVLGMLLVLVCFLLYENTTELRINNDIEREDIEIELQDQRDSLRAEYDRIVLGCNTAGAMESGDKLLRELCDETLADIRKELFGIDS